MTPLRVICVAVCLTFIGAGSVTAEQISIGFEAAQGYTPSTSIDGQPSSSGAKWILNKPDYDEEVSNAVGAAHAGTQGFRWSNSYFDTVVQAIASPLLTVPAGETGSTAMKGAVPAPANSNHFVQDFWFRSVKTSADTGLNVNVCADDGLDLRMTFLRIRENAGALEASYVGYDVGTGSFPSFPVAPSLGWGTWYHVRVDIEFYAGPSNDVVRIYLGTSPTLGAADLKLTSSTWEDFYGPGNEVAVNSTLFRLSNDPGLGNLPQGLYMAAPGDASGAIP